MRGTAIGLALLAAGATAAVADFDERHSIEAERLEVTNLIGRIDVSGHDGRTFEVEVAVRGADGTRETIEVQLEQGPAAALRVLFPIQKHREYVYPPLGNGRVSFTLDDGRESGFLSRLFGSDELEVEGRGNGLEVWADVTIRVPRGGSLVVENGIGDVGARGVEASLALHSRSGRVDVAEVRGELTVDTGSGSVALDDVRGPSIAVDTGSGGVDGNGLEADEVMIDTGSGSVEVENVAAKKLEIDTGSGNVQAMGVDTDDLMVDTGSGSVEVELVRMGRGSFDIDTGSGGIALELPAGAGADIEASTGSGGVRFDLGEDVRVLNQDKDDVRLTLGDGGANVRLDTGSGSIHISR